jgi:hypothetical protein
MRTLHITTYEELRRADNKAVIYLGTHHARSQRRRAFHVGRRLSAFPSLFKHLVRCDHAEKNPVAEVERPAINRRHCTTLAFSKVSAAANLLGAPPQDTVEGLRDHAILSHACSIHPACNRAETINLRGTHQQPSLPLPRQYPGSRDKRAERRNVLGRRINPMADTAIFLGAGASKAEGAPLQGELFKEYFSSRMFKESHDSMDRDLAIFFQLMFQIDVDQDVSGVDFPTFEEVLGLTDLAIIRKEAFRNFDIENRAVNSSSLRFIAQHLVFLVAKILDAKLRDRAPLHRRLIKALGDDKKLRNIVFVSTNYDILIDNALTEQYSRGGGIDLDYGVEFRNFDRPDDWRRPKFHPQSPLDGSQVMTGVAHNAARIAHIYT